MIKITIATIIKVIFNCTIENTIAIVNIIVNCGNSPPGPPPLPDPPSWRKIGPSCILCFNTWGLSRNWPERSKDVQSKASSCQAEKGGGRRKKLTHGRPALTLPEEGTHQERFAKNTSVT